MKLVDVTKISKGFQTVVPASIRKRFELNQGDEVIWSVIGDEVYVRVRKREKEDPLNKLLGALPTEEDSDATKEMNHVAYEEG